MRIFFYWFFFMVLHAYFIVYSDVRDECPARTSIWHYDPRCLHFFLSLCFHSSQCQYGCNSVLVCNSIETKKKKKDNETERSKFGWFYLSVPTIFKNFCLSSSVSLKCCCVPIGRIPFAWHLLRPSTRLPFEMTLACWNDLVSVFSRNHHVWRPSSIYGWDELTK